MFASMKSSPAFVSINTIIEDADTNALLTWISKGSNSILVVDAEFSHVPELPSGHEREQFFVSDRDRIVRLPREVAALVIERPSGCESKWVASGKFLFTCVLPPKTYCAMIPSKTASVMSETAEAMEELEKELDVLEKRMPNLNDRTIGELLDDSSLFASEPELIYDVFDVIRSGLENQQFGSVIGDRILQKIEFMEKTKKGDTKDLIWIKKQLEQSRYNIQHSHCRKSPATQVVRNKCLDLYQNDAYYKLLLDDRNHKYMRLLVDALDRSTIVCKTQYFIGAVRNHCAKYKLSQPMCGIDILDVSIYDPNSRFLYGDAKLKTTSDAMEMTGWLRDVRDNVMQQMTKRSTPPPIHKCLMILQVALHIAGLFGVEFYHPSDDMCEDLFGDEE